MKYLINKLNDNMNEISLIYNVNNNSNKNKLFDKIFIENNKNNFILLNNNKITNIY